MKTVIIGGVAAGAGCAARLRRLDESAEIVLLERGKYISYANCGLPYYIGGVIRSREALFVTKKETMESRFNVDVRTESEVLSIDREAKQVTVRNLRENREYCENYDKLVIATGSSPLRPPIPGIDSERIMTLWTVPDTDRIHAMVKEKGAKTAAVVGGGFIGLETAENLRHAGLEVTLIEAMDQVMAPLDREMAELLHEHLEENGVELRLSDGVDYFREEASRVAVYLKSGKCVEADMVILSIGVRPNGRIAGDAGLALNERGGIITDEFLRTEDPDIYAAGDVIEVTDIVSGEPAMVPLAGPANKMGRIVADNIAGGEEVYRGSQGSSVAKVFDLTAAVTGNGEKALQSRGWRKGREYETVLVAQNSHAGYYPGAVPMMLKLIFTKDGGRVLGAQIVGSRGVDKRIDTIGTAIRLGASVAELKALELAYAPPYSSAKDPVNMAAFAAENVIRGVMRFCDWNTPDTDSEAVLLDVREEAEVMAYEIPGAVNIPLGQLRSRLGELDPEKTYITFCAVGVRAYTGARILAQHGFDRVFVYPGGVRFYASTHRESADTDAADPGSSLAPADKGISSENADLGSSSESADTAGSRTDGTEFTDGTQTRAVRRVSLDCCGMQCPGPIMEVFNSMKELEDGDVLEVTASDPGFTKDIAAWCRKTGNTLISGGKEGEEYIACVRKGTTEVERTSCEPGSHPCECRESGENAAGISGSGPQGKTIIVFDGDMDKVLASFIIANGALAMGRPVTMFFTFWGLTALRRPEKKPVKKSFVEGMFGRMLSRGAGKLKLGRMNMGGMGTAMMKRVMKDKNIDSLEALMKKAMDMGVRIIACSMSMDVMGIRKEELIDGVEIGGVGTYLGEAEDSNVNLFI